MSFQKTAIKRMVDYKENASYLSEKAKKHTPLYRG